VRKREGNATGGAAPRGLAGLVLVVLVPLCAGVFLSNYYRSMNAVLSPRLVAELHLTAGDLGLLTSLYFFTTAIFQAPLGLLMDRYGPRRVQGTLIAIAGVGVLIFAFGQGMGTMMLARAIIGLGGAGALMTAFQAVILWFPPARWPLLNGCTLGIGGVGALAATLPLELMLQVVPWRYAMVGLALASFAASWSILGVVPERPPAASQTTLRKQLSGVAVVYTDRLFWRIAPAYAATTGASFAFQGLWSAPWLKDVGHLAPEGVAANLVGLAVLQTASYVIVGMAGAALGRRGFDLL
jgi:MFS family permease